MQDYTKLVRRAYDYHGEAIQRARDEHGFTLDTDKPNEAHRRWMAFLDSKKKAAMKLRTQIRT